MSSKLMSVSVSSISPTTALWGGREGNECSVWIVCVRGGGVRWGGVSVCGSEAFLHITVEESHISEHIGTRGCSDD